MSSKQPLSFSQRLKAMYCAAGLPAIAVDSNFSILWCSDAASAALPYLAAPDGIRLFFEAYNIENIKAEIAAHGSFSISGDTMFDRREMTVCLLSDREEDGYLVLPPALPAQTDGKHPEGALRAVNVFEAQYNTRFHEIFLMLGNAARAASSDASPERSADAANHIECAEQAAFRALRSCKWVAGYTRLSQGLVPVTLVPVELFSWLHSLLEEAAKICAQRGILLRPKVPDVGLYTKFDKGLLADILANLLSNSCRFTREGNYIDVEVSSPKDGRLTIKVTDHGLGIPPEVLPHVFEPYYSYDRDGKAFSGNGLGLAIVWDMVALLGGTVIIHSENGEGAIVTFSLPITEDRDEIHLLEDDSFVYADDRFSALSIALSDSFAVPL